jgi:mono/diheme cytochrome c family protein
MKNPQSRLMRVLGVLGLLFVPAQLVPYGRDHTNPAVTKEPAWDSAQTRELARRACFDCHSNQSRWPWYSNIAPVSWLVESDVHEARHKLNFSAFDKPQKKARDAADEVREGGMPLWFYAMMHAEAQLSPAEHDALIKGLEGTFGSSEGPGGGADHHEH